METKTNKPHRNREEMLSLFNAWQSSGVSQDVFCKEHQLPYNVFQYWYRKFKKENKEDTGFVEMSLKPGNIFSSSCEIVFPSGARLVVSASTDPAFIRALIF